MKAGTKVKNLSIFALKVIAVMVVAEKVVPVRNVINKLKGSI